MITVQRNGKAPKQMRNCIQVVVGNLEQRDRTCIKRRMQKDKSFERHAKYRGISRNWFRGISNEIG